MDAMAAEMAALEAEAAEFAAELEGLTSDEDEVASALVPSPKKPPPRKPPPKPKAPPQSGRPKSTSPTIEEEEHLPNLFRASQAVGEVPSDAAEAATFEDEGDSGA